MPGLAVRAGAQPRGVGQHPHRGFETVTIVYDGEVAHRDSTGARRHHRPGRRAMDDGGAAASSMRSSIRPALPPRAGRSAMVQLWVNLPAKDKMTTPGYQGITDADIPTVDCARRAACA